jgi:hypothetical protein
VSLTWSNGVLFSADMSDLLLQVRRQGSHAMLAVNEMARRSVDVA